MRWFKHSTNMRHDPKIKRLIRNYGGLGYAVYNYIIESISGNLDKNSPNPELEETADDIAYELRIDTNQVEDIISFCVDEQLLIKDLKSGSIHCYKIYKFLDDTTRKSPSIRLLLEEC